MPKITANDNSSIPAVTVPTIEEQFVEIVNDVTLSPEELETKLKQASGQLSHAAMKEFLDRATTSGYLPANIASRMTDVLKAEAKSIPELSIAKDPQAAAEASARKSEIGFQSMFRQLELQQRFDSMNSNGTPQPVPFESAEGIVGNYDDGKHKSKADSNTSRGLVNMLGGTSFVSRSLNRSYVERVLNSSAKVPASNQYYKHIDATRKELSKLGLPTDAEGVRVIVMAEDDKDHSAAIVRTVAGKQTGLAKGADVLAPPPPKTEDELLKLHPLSSEYDAIKQKAANSTITISDLGKAGSIEADITLDFVREAVKNARENKSKDGKTTVATLSRGASPRSIAEKLAERVPFNSPAGQDVISEFQTKTGKTFDPKNNAHLAKTKEILIQKITGEVKKEIANQGITDSKKALENEVAEARKDEIIIFNAAGNEYVRAARGGDPGASINIMDDVKGLITVGNVNIGKAENKDDDVMAMESADGNIEIAAPGENIPVGKNGRKLDLVDGTSYAAPNAAAVAALMIKANPKITPDQIEAIMTNPENTRDLPGSNDGAGLIDVTKAVAAAAALK